MKRFLVFCCDTYYPSGGMDDFIGDFDTIKDATDALNDAYDKISYSGFGHVWDSDSRYKIKVVG
jgi:hypothetical protein